MQDLLKTLLVFALFLAVPNLMSKQTRTKYVGTPTATLLSTSWGTGTMVGNYWHPELH